MTTTVITLNITNNWSGLASGRVTYVSNTGVTQDAVVTLGTYTAPPSASDGSFIIPGRAAAPIAFSAAMLNADLNYKWSLTVYWGGLAADGAAIAYNVSHAFNDAAGALVASHNVTLGGFDSAASIAWYIIGGVVLIALVSCLVYIACAGAKPVAKASAQAYGGAIGPLSTSLLGL